MLSSILDYCYCNYYRTLKEVEEPLLTPTPNIHDISKIDIAKLMEYEPPFIVNKISQ